MPDVKVSPANELRRTPPPAPRRAAPSPPQSTSSVLFGGLGFIEIVRQTYNEVLADDCLGRAAQLAYYFLFQWFGQKLGGNSPISPEFFIVGVIFYPSGIQREPLNK
jgi:hypothetical protein